MPAALWFLLLCDKTVVERVPPPMLSWALALGLPMLFAGAEPPAPPGAALGPAGIETCASATPLERASAQAAIVEILSMLIPPFEGQDAGETSPASASLHERAALPHVHGTSLAVRRGAGQERMVPAADLEPSHLQSLPRARRDDGAADLRDAGSLDGAADRRSHRCRSSCRSGAGRRLCRHWRRRRLPDDDGLRRIDRALWRHAHDPDRHAGAGRGLGAAGLGRAGAGALHAVELAPAWPPVAAASRTAGLLDQADRCAGGPDGRGRGGAGA